MVLQRAVEDERFAKERLIAEARSRIEQYENRLAQVKFKNIRTGPSILFLRESSIFCT